MNDLISGHYAHAPTPETSGFFNQTIHHQPMRFQQIIFTKWVE